jgi:hypothetical protein
MVARILLSLRIANPPEPLGHSLGDRLFRGHGRMRRGSQSGKAAACRSTRTIPQDRVQFACVLTKPILPYAAQRACGPRWCAESTEQTRNDCSRRPINGIIYDYMPNARKTV